MKTALLFAFCLHCFYLTAQDKNATPGTMARVTPAGVARAVVVGISDYQSPQIPDLRFADRDATAFADWLRSPAGRALPPENIVLLTNKTATTGAIASAMDWLIAECQAGDRAIIYFSGHGDVETRTKFQRGFLLTYDSPPSNYLAGAFALIFLQDIISTLADQGVQVLMISDAWYEQAVARSPEQANNWFYYCQTAYILGHKEVSASVFHKYLALHPENNGFVNRMAIFYKNHSEYELTEQILKAAIERAPKAPFFYRNLARLYFFFGKKQEAYAVLEEAKKIAPDEPLTDPLYALLKYFDEPQSAKIHFDEIAKNNPDLSSLWDCLESMRQNEFEKADACWERVRAAPDWFWEDLIKYRYLQMKIRQGEKESALQLFSELLYGHVEYQLFVTDPGLDPIRDMEPFQELMRRFFPEKTRP